ncbi:MAG: hypothetical protein HYZ58_13210, partial [Acidobacteria bacterium]|nr:hypothetical protein [Acidobacteriota bacterium]
MPQATGTDAVSVQTGQLRDQELADSAFNLARVLGDGGNVKPGDKISESSKRKGISVHAPSRP